MIRRSVAGAILGASLMVASVAWWGYVSLTTVLEPDRSREVAQELLDNSAVRDRLVDSIGDALTASIPDGAPIADETVEAASAQVLQDPAIEALLLDAFTQSHAAFLGEGDAPESLDLTAVAEAARAAVVAGAPELEGVIPPAPVLAIPLPTEHIPDASPVRSLLERAVPLLAGVAIIGAATALLFTSDRPGILRRAGFWALTTTAVYLILGLAVPWLLRRFAPGGAEVLAAFFAALLRALVVPSVALGLVGAGLLAMSAMWATGGAVARSDRGRREPEPRRAPRAAAPKRGISEPSKRPSSGATPHPTTMPMRTLDPRVRTPPAGTPVQPGPSRPGPYPDAGSVFDGVAPPTDAPRRPAPGGPVAASAHSVFAPGQSAAPAPTPSASADSYAPTWLEGHGWVLHPDDPRPPPRNAIWVEGVGHVVPGPPPNR